LWERSSRNGHLLEDLMDDLGDRVALDLKFRPEYDPVFENRPGHGLDVIGGNKIPSGHGSIGAAR
jgi:hypothetical protein